jgi:hypothetical protein
MYFFGELIDGNYLIIHRSGFAHINFNPFDENIDAGVFRELDDFMKSNSEIPDYLMFYFVPEKLVHYWKSRPKMYFKVRRRRRYQIDNIRCMNLDRSSYAVPPHHLLRPLQQCPDADLEIFDLSLDSKFYESRDQFLRDSFGFVLYDGEDRPVSIAYLACLIGRNGESDVKTLPEFRNKGYGFATTVNYFRECISRKINIGWDCFMDNHTNRWVERCGYTQIIREYDFVSFGK